MAIKSLTMLIWVVMCAAVSLSSAISEPDSVNRRLSGTSGRYRSGNREVIDLIRRILDDENIDFDSDSDESSDDNSDLYEKLLHALSSHEADKDQLKKRSCFNLGGHCATQNAAKMADQYNYLKNPMSPGRRRRRSSSFSSSSSPNAAVRGHLDRKENQRVTRPNQRP